MRETTSTSNWHTRISEAALFLMITSSVPGPIILDNAGPSLFLGSMITTPTASRSQHLPGEALTWEDTRRAQIKALQGKYRDLLTPSEEFAMQKQNEMELEG